VIRLVGVSKSYGGGRIRALSDVSLEAAAGSFVVITGPSGSGKTTLLHVIGGMTRPERGEVQVAGKSILLLPDPELSAFRARAIGMIFQLPSLLPHLDALDNVRLPLYFAGRTDDPTAARALLRAAGLEGREAAFGHELSAGQERRVAVARALIVGAPIILADEPTGDLDPDSEAAIMKMLTEANGRGATIIMTTHNPALRSRAGRSLAMKDGRLSED
jgi:putative ABC transport system ATP-binding protein